MNEIAEVIKAVKAASGPIAKTAILKRNEMLPGLKETLRFIYNPYVRTGIGKQKIAKNFHSSHDAESLTLEEVIQYFSKNTTGADADVAFAWRFINQQRTLAAKNIATALIMQDLQIGVTETTLNKIWGASFIPKIGIMLAQKYPEFKHKVAGPFIVTEKLDGHRRLLIKDEDGTVHMYTRSGLPDEGLVDIEAEAFYLPAGYAYDGECLAEGDFKDSIALRQATGSIMNSKGVRRGVTFNVFDAIPVDELKLGKSEATALARKVFLGAIFKDFSIQKLTASYAAFIMQYGVPHNFKHIKPVEILGLVNTEAEILELAIPIWQRGFEGVMLNTVKGLYEIKRSSAVLKVKHTEEHVLTIIDFNEGDNDLTGTLGSVVVDYKGSRVGVGSGFNKDQRRAVWNNREAYLGKRIEIDTFGESTDRHGNISLNCPIFKRFVGEVD